MNRGYRKLISTCLVFVSLMSSLAFANDEDRKYNQIRFQAQTSESVANDRMQVILNAHGEDGDTMFRDRMIGRTRVVEIDTMDLDCGVATAFKDHLVSAFEAAGGAVVVVDFTKVRFMDSSCLGALLAAFRHTGSAAKVVLSAANDSVAQVFRIARLEKVMRVAESLDQGLDVGADTWPARPYPR